MGLLELINRITNVCTKLPSHQKKERKSLVQGGELKIYPTVNQWHLLTQGLTTLPVTSTVCLKLCCFDYSSNTEQAGPRRAERTISGRSPQCLSFKHSKKQPAKPYFLLCH